MLSRARKSPAPGTTRPPGVPACRRGGHGAADVARCPSRRWISATADGALYLDIRRVRDRTDRRGHTRVLVRVRPGGDPRAVSDRRLRDHDRRHPSGTVGDATDPLARSADRPSRDQDARPRRRDRGTAADPAGDGSGRAGDHRDPHSAVTVRLRRDLGPGGVEWPVPRGFGIQQRRLLRRTPTA